MTKDIGRAWFEPGEGEAIMFARRRTTTPLGQATRQQRSPACLVLALFALSSLLVLLTGCGTSNTAVTAPVTKAQSTRQVQMHLVPAPTISTTVRIAQRHLYPFSPSNFHLKTESSSFLMHAGQPQCDFQSAKLYGTPL